VDEDQIDRLIDYVRAAVRAAVAEANNKDDWAHNRLDDAEQKLIASLRKDRHD